MGKSIAEIKEELSSLRTEMYASSESTDLKLLASYLDRLIISLETLTDKMESMDASIDSMCGCCDDSKITKAKPQAKKAKVTKKQSKKAKRK